MTDDLTTMKTDNDTALLCLSCGSQIEATECEIKEDGSIRCPICKEDICQ